MQSLSILLVSALLSSLQCPGYIGHVTIQDYNGPVTFDMCVGDDFRIQPPNIYMTLYDPNTDGIFRNGFE